MLTGITVRVAEHDGHRLAATGHYEVLDAPKARAKTTTRRTPRKTKPKED